MEVDDNLSILIDLEVIEVVMVKVKDANPFQCGSSYVPKFIFTDSYLNTIN